MGNASEVRSSCPEQLRHFLTEQRARSTESVRVPLNSGFNFISQSRANFSVSRAPRFTRAGFYTRRHMSWTTEEKQKKQQQRSSRRSRSTKLRLQQSFQRSQEFVFWTFVELKLVHHAVGRSLGGPGPPVAVCAGPYFGQRHTLSPPCLPLL
ncbi:hypothetical protein SRHO_G00268270 [Serrasalmus rhombeus]